MGDGKDAVSLQADLSGQKNKGRNFDRMLNKERIMAMMDFFYGKNTNDQENFLKIVKKSELTESDIAALQSMGFLYNEQELKDLIQNVRKNCINTFSDKSVTRAFFVTMQRQILRESLQHDFKKTNPQGKISETKQGDLMDSEKALLENDEAFEKAGRELYNSWYRNESGSTQGKKAQEKRMHVRVNYFVRNGLDVPEQLKADFIRYINDNNPEAQVHDYDINWKKAVEDRSITAPVVSVREIKGAPKPTVLVRATDIGVTQLELLEVLNSDEQLIFLQGNPCHEKRNPFYKMDFPGKDGKTYAIRGVIEEDGLVHFKKAEVFVDANGDRTFGLVQNLTKFDVEQEITFYGQKTKIGAAIPQCFSKFAYFDNMPALEPIQKPPVNDETNKDAAVSSNSSTITPKNQNIPMVRFGEISIDESAGNFAGDGTFGVFTADEAEAAKLDQPDPPAPPIRDETKINAGEIKFNKSKPPAAELAPHDDSPNLKNPGDVQTKVKNSPMEKPKASPPPAAPPPAASPASDPPAPEPTIFECDLILHDNAFRVLMMTKANELIGNAEGGQAKLTEAERDKYVAGTEGAKRTAIDPIKQRYEEAKAVHAIAKKQYDQLKAEVTQLKDEIATLNANISSLTAQSKNVNKTADEKSILSNQINQKNSEITQINTKLNNQSPKFLSAEAAEKKAAEALKNASSAYTQPIEVFNFDEKLNLNSRSVNRDAKQKNAMTTYSEIDPKKALDTSKTIIYVNGPNPPPANADVSSFGVRSKGMREYQILKQFSRDVQVAYKKALKDAGIPSANSAQKEFFLAVACIETYNSYVTENKYELGGTLLQMQLKTNVQHRAKLVTDQPGNNNEHARDYAVNQDVAAKLQTDTAALGKHDPAKGVKNDMTGAVAAAATKAPPISTPPAKPT